MKNVRVLLSARAWLILSFVLGVLPLCLSSTEMWDGVVVVHSLITNDWSVIKSLAFDSNWYITYVIFLAAEILHQTASVPYVVCFKAVLVLLIVGIAFELYLLARRVFDIPDAIAVWLPSLVFSFPVWYVMFSYTSMLGHITCVWFGLIGYRLLHGNKRWTFLLGLLLVGMSFQLASNCAFLLGMELGLWLVCENKRQWPYRRSMLLLLLAVLVFAATRVIWPPVGTYIGYNRFLNPLQLQSWNSYAKYSALFATWLVLLVPTLVGLWWATKGNRVLTISLRKTFHENRIKIGVYFLLILAACAPYIAVGVGSPLFTVNLVAPGGSVTVSSVLATNAAFGPVGIWFGGWGARHVLLMMIPIVLLMGWLATMTYRFMHGEISTNGNLTSGAFIFTIGFCLLIGVSGHWAKLKRLAKERTVVLLLASKPPLPYGQVDLLLDKREDFLSAIYETNYLLYQAYKSTHWVALMLPENQMVQAWGDENRRITLDQADKDRLKIAGLNLMGQYDWNNNCKTIARIKLPKFEMWDVLWRTEHAPHLLPRAGIVPVSSTCSSANTFWHGSRLPI